MSEERLFGLDLNLDGHGGTQLDMGLASSGESGSVPIRREILVGELSSQEQGLVAKRRASARLAGMPVLSVHGRLTALETDPEFRTEFEGVKAEVVAGRMHPVNGDGEEVGRDLQKAAEEIDRRNS